MVVGVRAASALCGPFPHLSKLLRNPHTTGAKIIVEKIIQDCHKIAHKIGFIIVCTEMTRSISLKFARNNS